ncbi:hypothetical protein M422DRAFT_83068, partial [Sphaerobolus stellatus SS14]
RVVSANKLRNGGVVYELDSANAATAIQEEEELHKAFMDNFGADATIKPRLYPIIVERVPTSFNPTYEGQLRQLEDANDLQNYEVAKARWIKPTNHREPNQ